jgi:hypothetical protein
MVPLGRCGAFPLSRGVDVLLGCSLFLLLSRGRGPSLGSCRMGSSACGFGVEVAGQDDGVQGQSSGERGDPSKSGDNILASAQHQAAVDNDPEELFGRQGTS